MKLYRITANEDLRGPDMTGAFMSIANGATILVGDYQLGYYRKLGAAVTIDEAGIPASGIDDLPDQALVKHEDEHSAMGLAKIWQAGTSVEQMAEGDLVVVVEGG